MKMAEEYKYGDPIPEKYRNRLFDWEGGGFDGCLWMWNQGLVDNDGHWIPILSNGHDGIDQDEWYERKIAELKADLGYDVRPAKIQFDEVWIDLLPHLTNDKGLTNLPGSLD